MTTVTVEHGVFVKFSNPSMKDIQKHLILSSYLFLRNNKNIILSHAVTPLLGYIFSKEIKMTSS